ncbi:MAG TPA: DNA replication and repair protein RecF [Actinomycetota bacterium]
MRLLWVELRDYRNHAHTRVELGHDGIIVVAGPNGEGKTNLLEAMHFLYALGSPRVSASEPLVRHGADAAYVRGEFETRDGRVLVEVEIRRKGANRVQVDRSTVRRRRDLRRAVRVVLFGPFDLPIVTGDPARRRGFMDEIVVLLQPARDTLTSSYERVLRQRNRLLKEHEGRGAPPELEAWDEQLIQSGTAVIEARAEAVNAIAPPASEAFSSVSGYELVVRYAPNVPTTDGEEGFRHRLDERRSDELQRRTSLVGPHRDDLDLAVRDLGARSFASHGETWVAALAVRLGLATAVEAAIGEPPVLLVDDPYSALDPTRRDRIAGSLAARPGQVVISVADEADVPAQATAILDVSAGNVIPRHEAA